MEQIVINMSGDKDDAIDVLPVELWGLIAYWSPSWRDYGRLLLTHRIFRLPLSVVEQRFSSIATEERYFIEPEIVDVDQRKKIRDRLFYREEEKITTTMNYLGRSLHGRCESLLVDKLLSHPFAVSNYRLGSLHGTQKTYQKFESRGCCHKIENYDNGMKHGLGIEKINRLDSIGMRGSCWLIEGVDPLEEYVEITLWNKGARERMELWQPPPGDGFSTQINLDTINELYRIMRGKFDFAGNKHGKWFQSVWLPNNKTPVRRWVVKYDSGRMVKRKDLIKPHIVVWLGERDMKWSQSWMWAPPITEKH